MKISKLAALLLTAASLPIAAQAQAQDAGKPAIAAGAMVYGPQGGEVGTIEKVDGEMVVVNTGKHSATLPSSSIGSSDKGLAIGFTQAQLNGAIEAAQQAAQAKVEAALVAGANVRTADGLPLGTIESIGEDGNVVVKREAGPFSLAKDMFALDANGLTVRMTAQQVEDALAQTAEQ